MVPLQQAALVGREVQLVAVAPQRVDAGEQARIEHDLDPMRRQLWRVVAVDAVADPAQQHEIGRDPTAHHAPMVPHPGRR